MTQKNNAFRGYILSFSAAALWGVSGTCSQYLFESKKINVEWLVVVRLLLAGILLLSFAFIKKQDSLWTIWKNRKEAVSLVLFGIFGMLAVQYTYFAAIHHSNAATATVLQYLGPVIIACYMALRNRKLPSFTEMIAIFFALLGTFFLVTHGRAGSLAISGKALFWGIASAFALASYTLQPVSLLKKRDAATVIGWGMLTGGIVFSFVHAPWNTQGIWDAGTISLFVFIILLGTLVAFYAYLVSVKYIGATRASLMACTEPLSAAITSVIWLKVAFGMMDWIGAFLIIITIFLLTRNKEEFI